MLSRAWFYYAGDETAAVNGGVGIGTAAGAGAVGMRQDSVGGSGGKMAGQDVLDMLGSL